MLSSKQIAIRDAERARAIYVYEPVLDKGQERQRKLWLRPEVDTLLKGSRLDERQLAVAFEYEWEIVGVVY